MAKTERKVLPVKLVATKATGDGVKRFRAIVTAPTQDRDYDTVDAGSMRVHLKGTSDTVQAKNLTGNEDLDTPLFVDHSNSIKDQIGSARSGFLDGKGQLDMEFELIDTELTDALYQLIQNNHLGNNVSIGFVPGSYAGDDKIYDSELLEVSLVWKGSNKDAQVLGVTKMFHIDEKDIEIDVETEETVVKEEPTEEETETLETETDNKDNKDSTENETDDTAEEVEKENNKMTKNEETVATEVVAAPVEKVAKQEKVTKKFSADAVRKNFVEQLKASYSNSAEMVLDLARQGAEMENVETKALDLSGVYLSEVLKSDVKDAFYDAGGVGTLVTREVLTDAILLSLPIETRGAGFYPTGQGAAKHEDAPVLGTAEVRPFEYSIVTQWSDSAAQQTPIQVYNRVVRYIANELKALEDRIILTYEGGSDGVNSRPATGLVPLLETAHRSSAVTALTAQYFVPGLAAAFGNIESNGELTLVANRKTWGQMATAQDANYNTVFNVVGDKVTAGALGMFTVVTSETLDDGAIVVGDFKDYVLVTRGGLSTLFSQEATVGAVNLFTQNGSALRASIEIAGTALPIKSFWLLTAAPYVS